MKKVMKTVLVGGFLAILIVGLAGCGPSKEQVASDTLKLNLDRFKSGTLNQSDIDVLTRGFDQMGLSQQGNQNMVDAVKNMASKLTYEIKSSKADANDPNMFVVNADIKTVDGTAIFTNDAAVIAMTDAIYESLKNNATDQTSASKAAMEVWSESVLTASKSATATKSANIDFKLKYDDSTKTISPVDDGTVGTTLIGLDANAAGSLLQQKLNDKINEKIAELKNAA